MSEVIFMHNLTTYWLIFGLNWRFLKRVKDIKMIGLPGYKSNKNYYLIIKDKIDARPVILS